jgi:hypothetical protein
MNEAFKKYWQNRLKENPSLDYVHEMEAKKAFKAAFYIKINQNLKPFLKGTNKNEPHIY